MNTDSQDTKKTQTQVVYVCAEYALDPAVSIYAGGLGVLAGDIMREAFELHVPMIGIGLLYQTGYRDDVPIPIPPHLEAVKSESGEPLIIAVPIDNVTVTAKVWKWEKNTVPIYLLDTRTNSNSPEDIAILDRLYSDDKEKRIKQQMILGIGARRLVEKLNLDPKVYHLNEGHSAFLAIDLIAQEMKKNTYSFEEACHLAKQKLVFTNHTLVMAGNEVYPLSLVSYLFKKYALETGISNAHIISLGQIPQSQEFSMTELSLKMTCRANTVSKLHQIQAEKIWTQYKPVQITNGISLSRWDMLDGVNDSENDVLTRHEKQKQDLLDFIEQSSGFKWNTNDLLIGWARRIVSYKQPLEIFTDVENLLNIVSSSDQIVRFVFSGLPHRSDATGVLLLAQLKQLFARELKGHAVYLDSYSLKIGQLLTAGTDVWLNTPIIGYEACGTSGMKASLNGALSCSTRDGWMYEVDLEKMGWELDGKNLSKSFCKLLKEKIIPEYSQRTDPDSVWKQKMRYSRKIILENYSATRMLNEYISNLYKISTLAND